MQPRFAALGRDAPDVDGKEQEQPDHVNKVPVPCRGFKADVLFGGEVPRIARISRPQEDRPDHHVEAVETCGHEEVREELVAAKFPALVQQVAYS